MTFFWLSFLVVTVILGGIYLIVKEVRAMVHAASDKIMPARIEAVITTGLPNYQGKTCYDCRNCIATGANLTWRCSDTGARKFNGGKLGWNNCPFWIPAKQLHQLSVEDQKNVNNNNSSYLPIEGV